MYRILYFLIIFSTTLLIPEQSIAGPSDKTLFELEGGYTGTSGNTRTDSFVVAFRFSIINGQSENEFSGRSHYSRSGDTRTSEKYEYNQKNRFLFTLKSYAFFRFTYLHDSFSAFEYESSEAAGYGRYLLRSDRVTLSAEAGPGARQSESVMGGYENEYLAYLSGRLNWKISDSIAFLQSLEMEFTENRTVTVSVSSLESSITQALAFKATLDVRDNSKPQSERERTDTTTMISLIYRFRQGMQ